jgi:hypothetical protein
MFGRSRFEDPSSFRVTLSLLCVGVFLITAGCGNNCFGGFFNGNNNSSTTIIGFAPPSCSRLSPTIAVKTVAHLAHACTSCSASRQVIHLHLLLSGIELHPSVVADENSPDWQELAPDWALHPQWIDLVEDSNSNQTALSPIVTGQIPARTYYQLRLHLAESSPQSLEQSRGENHCSSDGAGCVVTADGGSYPLQTYEDHSYLRVEATSPIDFGGNQSNLLRIELHPEWALQVSSTGVLDVLPLLRGRVVIEPSPATDPL